MQQRCYASVTRVTIELVAAVNPHLHPIGLSCAEFEVCVVKEVVPGSMQPLQSRPPGSSQEPTVRWNRSPGSVQHRPWAHTVLGLWPDGASTDRR